MVPVGGEVGINWAESGEECCATVDEVITGVENAT
jgi:hypothetical protein